MPHGEGGVWAGKKGAQHRALARARAGRSVVEVPRHGVVGPLRREGEGREGGDVFPFGAAHLASGPAAERGAAFRAVELRLGPIVEAEALDDGVKGVKVE